MGGGLGEDGRGGGVLGAARRGVRGRLGAEQDDVVGDLRDRERQLGRSVERLSDRLVACPPLASAPSISARAAR